MVLICERQEGESFQPTQKPSVLITEPRIADEHLFELELLYGLSYIVFKLECNPRRTVELSFLHRVSDRNIFETRERAQNLQIHKKLGYNIGKSTVPLPISAYRYLVEEFESKAVGYLERPYAPLDQVV